MLRLFVPALFVALSACGADTPPPATAASGAQLFRGAGHEVRLRCGSERLRARLRQGQVLAQLGDGEATVLVPVDGPRAGSGQAYSDGRLTLYKLPDSPAWALADGASGAAQCRHEPAGDQGTGKSAIPAR